MTAKVAKETAQRIVPSSSTKGERDDGSNRCENCHGGHSSADCPEYRRTWKLTGDTLRHRVEGPTLLEGQTVTVVETETDGVTEWAERDRYHPPAPDAKPNAERRTFTDVWFHRNKEDLEDWSQNCDGELCWCLHDEDWERAGPLTVVEQRPGERLVDSEANRRRGYLNLHGA